MGFRLMAHRLIPICLLAWLLGRYDKYETTLKIPNFITKNYSVAIDIIGKVSDFTKFFNELTINFPFISAGSSHLIK